MGVDGHGHKALGQHLHVDGHTLSRPPNLVKNSPATTSTPFAWITYCNAFGITKPKLQLANTCLDGITPRWGLSWLIGLLSKYYYSHLVAYSNDSHIVALSTFTSKKNIASHNPWIEILRRKTTILSRDCHSIIAKF